MKNFNVESANIVRNQLMKTAKVRPLTSEEKRIGQEAVKVIDAVRQKKHAASYLVSHDKEVERLISRGYSRREAELQLRTEAITVAEANGFGTSHRCWRGSGMIPLYKVAF